MVGRLLRRMDSEEGISLVEVMIAIVILALILMGLAATLTTSLRALVANESRVKANALANDTLEDLQSLPWGELEDLEELVESDGGTTTLNGPWEDDGYEVNLAVVWADDPSVGGSDHYLEFTVTIDWDDLGTDRSVTHDGRRSPPAVEVDEQATVRSIRPDPEIGYLRENTNDADIHGRIDERVEFNEDGDTVVTSVGQGTVIDVTTTAPVDTVAVAVEGRDGDLNANLSSQNAPDDTEWRLQSSQTSNWKYRNGDTTFHLTFTTDDGDVFTATKVVRYVFKDVGPVDEDPAPRTVCVDEDGAGESTVEVAAEFWGLTADDIVEVSGAGLDPSDEWLADRVESTDDGSVFEFELAEGHEYPDAEETVLTMTGTRSFDGHTGEVELTLVLDPDHDDYDEGVCVE